MLAFRLRSSIVVCAALAGAAWCFGCSSDFSSELSQPGTTPDGGADARADSDAAPSEAQADAPTDSTKPDVNADGAAPDVVQEVSDVNSNDVVVADAPEEPDAAEEACTATTWYRDKDGDTFGDSSDHVDACTEPAGYVATPGDCKDDNVDVHPGQTSFFGAGYPDPNKPGGISFDYDCNGAEESESGAKKAPACAGLLVCQGDGFEPYAPARSGPGIDSYCGSNQLTTCTLQGIACKANTVSSTEHYVCR